jgi:Zn-dependent peptidase ImmA (M78 family)
MGTDTSVRSIQDWSRAAGERDPSIVMVRLAEALRQEYYQRNRKRVALPVPVGKFAILRKIKEFRIRNINHTASLIMTRNGFACTLSEGETSGARKNFAIAHEIGHTMFFDISHWPPSFLIQPELMHSQEAERLCNIFAGALLIPEGSLTSIAQALSRRLAFDEIDRLSDEFAVSREVLIRRLRDSESRGQFTILSKPWFRLGATI